jgi:ATP-dependent DNA helicase RecG
VIRNQVMFRPRRQLLVTIEDETASLQLRFLNFYPSQQKQMAVGAHLRVRGEIRDGHLGSEMVHPTVKAVAADSPLPKSLTPVYPATAGVSQTVIRKAVAQALIHPTIQTFLADVLPAQLMTELLPGDQWYPLHQAIHYLHQPPADADTQALLERTHPAWRRVQFEELLAQQISLKRAHAARRQRRAPQLLTDPKLATKQTKGKTLEQQLLAVLPFQLTQAQERVWAEIQTDLTQPFPMNRLLQGDVGSGKTY